MNGSTGSVLTAVTNIAIAVPPLSCSLHSISTANGRYHAPNATTETAQEPGAKTTAHTVYREGTARQGPPNRSTVRVDTTAFTVSF